VILWCAAGAISVFAGALLWRTQPADRVGRFLIWGGLLTLMLMGDDFFTVHEGLSFHLGIPDFLIVGLYAALAGVYFLVFRDVIWRTDYLLLAVALAFLGTSIVVDALDPKDSPLIFALVGDRYHLVEDGPKLIGISVWLGYFARVSWVTLRSRMWPDPGSAPLAR
jgi:hypothetical protein